MEERIKTITLSLTESCNLNCVYCYENNKSTKNMSFDDAKRIIDIELENPEGYDKLYFELFGGEPFLQFPVMKQIVEYLRDKLEKVPFRILITTNGTLVHGEVQKWLLENSDIISVSLSCDGTPQMHNRNRSNSFELIDLDFFRNYSSSPRVKMTVSLESLESLSEGIIFLHQQGFAIDCNLAFGISWDDSKAWKTLYDQLWILIDFYLKNPKIKPCSMLYMHIENVLTEHNGYVKKWCGTGTNMVTYDVNLNKYPCQYFMPLSMGQEKSVAGKEIRIPSEIPISYLPEMCQSCPCVDLCPTCYGSNFAENGNVYYKSKEYCNLMKIVILANSYLKWKQINSGEFFFDDLGRSVIKKSIVVIQEWIRQDAVFEDLFK